MSLGRLLLPIPGYTSQAARREVLEKRRQISWGFGPDGHAGVPFRADWRPARRAVTCVTLGT